jgi:hypothetical protein
MERLQRNNVTHPLGTVGALTPKLELKSKDPERDQLKAKSNVGFAIDKWHHQFRPVCWERT